MGEDFQLTVTLSDPVHIENLKNAARAVENHEDVTVSRGRGRPAEGEISRAEVVNQLAVAYTGVDVGDRDG